ncbi:hypothetical protein LTV02_05560 [Nocardia yamanashiensis]|uniref:SMP-30/gluconolactonase/LRE family protein n=1 Tax=Nocardia yamanashiensis TaxID=209247 RepID=UPI001E4A246B|nr:hypothetical protein [Nocardia yamanashiensis]UGT42869.1 hypothetical protein LTV02_05560 [Nocardia yamanashiensis]
MNWTENLAFDGLGGLWVSRVSEARIARYDASGRETASVTVPGLGYASPSGIVHSSDGRMYVAIPWTPVHAAEIIRFDPGVPNPIAETFATDLGLVMANGLAVDDGGNLYVTDMAQFGITKIRVDGTVDTAWTQATKNLFGTNGIEVHDDAIYTSVTFDTTNPIYRVPLDRPQDFEPYTRLGYAPPFRALDDLTITPDGTIYLGAVTSPFSGNVFRIDPTSHDATVVYSGQPVTSVRFAIEFGAATGDLFATSMTGDIVRIPL